jgi:hypothetical protein
LFNQPPNQQLQQQFQPPLPNSVNGPFPGAPNRQRSVNTNGLNDELINTSLMQFIRSMEMQFRDKHQRNGEKLDGMCEDRFFCEIALSGRLPNADALHRMLYHVALE